MKRPTFRSEAVNTTVTPGDWVDCTLFVPAIKVHYDSVHDFVGAIEHRPRVWVDLPLLKSDARSSAFTEHTGTKCLSEAISLAQIGWADGVNKIKIGDGYVPPLSRRAVPHCGYDVSGLYPEVPRFVSGDIECMVDIYPRTQLTIPILHLSICSTTSADVSAHQFENWGAALLSWVDVLVGGSRRADLVFGVCAPMVQAGGYEMGARPGFCCSGKAEGARPAGRT